MGGVSLFDFMFPFFFISVLEFTLFKIYFLFYKLVLIKVKGHFRQFIFKKWGGGYASVIMTNKRPYFGIFQNSG